MLSVLSTSSDPARCWNLLPADTFTTLMEWDGGESRRVRLVNGHGHLPVMVCMQAGQAELAGTILPM